MVGVQICCGNYCYLMKECNFCYICYLNRGHFYSCSFFMGNSNFFWEVSNFFELYCIHVNATQNWLFYITHVLFFLIYFFYLKLMNFVSYIRKFQEQYGPIENRKRIWMSGEIFFMLWSHLVSKWILLFNIRIKNLSWFE